MNIARSQHSATLLEDGRVLVAGGYEGPTWVASNSAEIYDPKLGSWTMTGAMQVARANPAAVRLLDGRVLAVSEGSAELFDPATGTWSATGAPLTHRWSFTLTMLADGAVLMAGGANEDYNVNGDQALATAEIYRPATGAWRKAASMAQGRYWHTASRLADGSVLVAGGATLVEYHGYTALAERYDPEADRWLAAGTTPPARSLHAVAELDDASVVIVGGYSTCSDPGITDPGTAGLCSHISTHRYASGSGWRAGASLNAPRNSHTLTRLGSGHFLAVGGSDWTHRSMALASTDLYDPQADSWVAGPDLTVPRIHHTTTLLPNGAVLVAGGKNAAEAALRSAELFVPRGSDANPLTRW